MSLTLSGAPSWFMSHMSGSLPTPYTWDCHCLGVLRVLGSWLNAANAQRQCMWTRIWVGARLCRGPAKRGTLKSSTVKTWARFWICFYADLSDPLQVFRAHVFGDIVEDTGLDLRNPLSWDVVPFLLRHNTFEKRQTSLNTHAQTTITSKMWTCVVRCFGPKVFPVFDARHVGTPRHESSGGIEHFFVTRYVAVSYAELSLLHYLM